MPITLYPLPKQTVGPEERFEKLFHVDVEVDDVLPDLHCVYVEDMGDHYSWLLENRISELGVSINEIKSLSMRCLRDKIDKYAEIEVLERGIYSVFGLETIESSVVFASDIINKFGFNSKKHLVSIPNRESFLFCDQDDSDARERMEKLAMEIYDESKASRKLTTRLIKIENDQSLHYV